MGRQMIATRSITTGCVNKLRVLLISFLFAHATAADPIRARDLGIPFDGTPGPLNAITDVEGVTVGHVTIIKDLADNRAVRTGVTAVFPRGRKTIEQPVFAGSFALNANGEMTGLAWIEESGFLETPVMITNTHSVGAVHQATIEWRVAQAGPDAGGYFWSLPVVGETWDGYLNDVNGFHVKREHVFSVLDSAANGPVLEGSVGGGTGMICFEFKCGIGTSSRVVSTGDSEFTVGVLLQANFGSRESLLIAGVPVGQHMRDHLVLDRKNGVAVAMGSIIIVIATGDKRIRNRFLSCLNRRQKKRIHVFIRQGFDCHDSRCLVRLLVGRGESDEKISGTIRCDVPCAGQAHRSPRADSVQLVWQQRCISCNNDNDGAHRDSHPVFSIQDKVIPHVLPDGHACDAQQFPASEIGLQEHADRVFAAPGRNDPR